MSAGSVALPVRRGASGAGLAWPALALGVLGLLWLFRPEAAAAVQVWRGSSAFGHCFLVPPIAGWLAWDRRAALACHAPRPTPWAALLAAPLVLAWLAAERLGLMEARQLAALSMIEMLFLAVLGWRLVRAFAVPLLYLYFLVPFGAFLVPWLQHFTAGFIGAGLGVLNIPHVVTDLRIEVPSGEFRVAEACAGLRFLVAALAFGVLYACLMYRGPWRRLAFIAAALVVPVMANGARALGIVVLGDIMGDPAAAVADHLIYGWVFFSMVIAVMILAGLPFRQDARPGAAAAPGGSPRNPGRAPPPPGSETAARRPTSAALAAAAVLAVACAGPAVAAALERRAVAAQASLPPGAAGAVLAHLVAPSGCRIQDELPAPLVGAAASVRVLQCAAVRVVVTAEVFASRVGAARLVAARHAITGDLLAEDATVTPPRGPGDCAGRRAGRAGWTLTRTSHPARVVASALSVAGAPGLGGLALRLRAATASILGPLASPSILVGIAAAPAAAPPTDQAEAAVLSVLDANPALGCGAGAPREGG